MRTVESSTALGMVVAIFFDYLRNFLLFLLGALPGIRGAVLDTGHGVLDLRVCSTFYT